MRQYDAQVWLDCGLTLGEGPVWDPERQCLWFVDIDGRQLLCADAQKNVLRYSMPFKIGTCGLTTAEQIVVALEDGLYLFTPSNQGLRLVERLNTDPLVRFNDGKCGPAGSFWAGTMAKAENKPLGALYRWQPGKGAMKMAEGIICSNGIAHSLDSRTMYYIDSFTHAVDAFDYDPETGDIRNRRTVLRIDPADGVPDGMTIDCEGMLWVAQWGGFQVGRYDPATGEKLARVNVPVECTSCPTFGGANLDTLFITTANKGKKGLPESHPGAIFTAQVGVRGLAPYLCKL